MGVVSGWREVYMAFDDWKLLMQEKQTCSNSYYYCEFWDWMGYPNWLNDHSC